MSEVIRALRELPSNWPSCLPFMQGSRDAVFMSPYPCWGGVCNDAGVFESPIDNVCLTKTAGDVALEQVPVLAVMEPFKLISASRLPRFTSLSPS